MTAAAAELLFWKIADLIDDLGRDAEPSANDVEQLNAVA